MAMGSSVGCCIPDSIVYPEPTLTSFFFLGGVWMGDRSRRRVVGSHSISDISLESIPWLSCSLVGCRLDTSSVTKVWLDNVLH